MRVAYLDCASGISGDMTLGAFVDAGVSLDAIQEGIDSLGLPDCRLESEEVHRKGFRATKVHVRHEPEHAHRHLHHITDMIDASILSDRQKQLATDIFTRLGKAEAHVHGTTLRKVHFHEVGAVDSIATLSELPSGGTCSESSGCCVQRFRRAAALFKLLTDERAFRRLPQRIA